MITEWEMYWLLKLDDIKGMLLFLNLITVLVAVVLLFVWGCCSYFPNDSNDIAIAKKAQKILLPWFIFSVLLFLCITITPDTKQMAMIKVIPAIANGKAVEMLKGDAADLYKLGINAAKEYLKGKNP